MNPLTPMPFPETSFAMTLGLLLLAPMAIAGVALMNSGLGRSRSAAQSLLGSLVVISTAVIAFALVGSAIAAGTSGDHVFHLAGKAWNWAGAGPLFSGVSALPDHARNSLCFSNLLSVALVVLIPWGSGADRLRLPAGAVIAAITGASCFRWSRTGHGAADGWLNWARIFRRSADFFDGGGAAAIHALGGVSALAVVWIAGPRKGKFPREGLSTAMPGHNVVYVLLGCLIALVGWLAWNMAGSLLWLNAGARCAGCYGGQYVSIRHGCTGSHIHGDTDSLWKT